MPKEAQQTVKRIIENAQTHGNVPSEAIKTRVIQELESASFGGKEPIRQAIMKDMQKAFLQHHNRWNKMLSK